MAATPILTQATTMTFTNASASPVTVNGVTAITGIGSGSAAEIDITTLASTAKEFDSGLRDFGAIDIELIRNQDDSGQAEMFSAMALQATRTIVITLPTSTANVATFTGFVKSMTTDIAADGVAKGKAVIRITGPVVWS